MGLSVVSNTRDEIQWSKSHSHVVTFRCVVVVAEERNNPWRRVVNLLVLGFLPRVDQGTAHLMVGSSAGVEMVTGKGHWKNFLVGARCSDDGGRIRSFL